MAELYIENVPGGQTPGKDAELVSFVNQGRTESSQERKRREKTAEGLPELYLEDVPGGQTPGKDAELVSFVNQGRTETGRQEQVRRPVEDHRILDFPNKVALGERQKSGENYIENVRNKEARGTKLKRRFVGVLAAILAVVRNKCFF